MIENPHDLIVIRLALQHVIKHSTDSRNAEYVADARETLTKVERLEADWISARANRRPRPKGGEK